ncbi:SURF1 family protein [Arenibacterium halophilum]|uniref:SURF1-like protein n=1 Tax=Arenibacterium halophilum TaxID=2583821 RepID=A0ABY2XDP5_9RHOB|nr:SURF1 family protein [Arenibacterium halophilum]TMV15128.1 SURF1 family protein [Arenibacterium halophilum]
MKRFGFLIVFGLTGFAVLIGLGIWQVQRLDWKRGILAEIEAKIAAPEVGLPDAPDAETDKYLAVQVAGTILPGELHVLVSRKNIGAGFRIIAPFETDGGRRILLDRGFVPAAQAKDTRSLGPVTVDGNLHWPDETDKYTPEPDLKANTWFARDVPAMAAALGTEPVLLVARTDTGPSPMPVGTEGIPNDHLQYAITWFSLALIWAAMTAFFLWRPGAPKNG